MSQFLKCYVHRALWTDSFEFLLVDKSPSGTAIGNAVEMRTVSEGAIAEETYPTFRLSYDAAQVLLNELWNAGLRPQDGSGSSGEIAATQKHLQDMREIATKLLDHELSRQNG